MLPFRVIIVPSHPDVISLNHNLVEYQEWLGDNCRAPWMPWLDTIEGKTCYVYLFADDIDAFAFRMYIR